MRRLLPECYIILGIIHVVKAQLFNVGPKEKDRSDEDKFTGCKYIVNDKFCPGNYFADRVCEGLCNTNPCWQTTYGDALTRCIENALSPLGCTFHPQCDQRGDTPKEDDATIGGFADCGDFVSGPGCQDLSTDEDCRKACELVAGSGGNSVEQCMVFKESQLATGDYALVAIQALFRDMGCSFKQLPYRCGPDPTTTTTVAPAATSGDVSSSPIGGTTDGGVLAPINPTIDTVKKKAQPYIYVGAASAGVLVAVSGLGYALYRRRAARRAEDEAEEEEIDRFLGNGIRPTLVNVREADRAASFDADAAAQ